MTDSTPSDARVWFITGSSSGMGRSLALAALERGERVVATARNPAGLTDIVDRFPGQVIAVQLDVRDQAAADSAVAAGLAAFGGIDVVFNNAGYALLGSVEETSDEQARALFDTGVFGVLNVLRAALPVLRRQRRGHVVQMSSIFGHMSYPGTGMLAAVKHAVEGLTQALAAELAGRGVAFTIVEPGALKTSFLSRMVRARPRIADYEESVYPVLEQLSRLPAGAMTDPAEVTDAILRVVAVDEPPLHLAVGRGAEEEIRASLISQARDLAIACALTQGADAR